MTTRLACLLVLSLAACTGCFRVDMYAPHGRDVYLISSEKPAEVKRSWRTWFVAWGLVPLDKKMPDSFIAQEQLTDVRVITIDTVPDAILGFLYTVLIPIGLVNQSMIIEGNRAPTPPPPPPGPVSNSIAATSPSAQPTGEHPVRR